MEKRFNIAGICRPDDHYILPPLRRLPTVRQLVDDKAYFVLHAPRQVGKSTCLSVMGQTLTAEGRFCAILLSVEVGAPFCDNVSAAELAILQSWRSAAQSLLPAELRPPPWPEAPPGLQINQALTAWARACPRPLVVFIDEIDGLSNAALISVLRQLRDGYVYRPHDFPWALGLCGMRDVRDYKVAAGGSSRLGSASPFNIKISSLTVRNFTEDEVGELLCQHSAATGQPFEAAALRRVYEFTSGQPWLVNALARELVQELVPDRRQPISADFVDQAKEILIQRRDTHLDSLAERLREPRVRRIIEPILVGAHPEMDVMNDDLLYVRDLGLIVDRPQVRIANPIYQELIPRSLTYVMQSFMVQESAWYLRDDGTLDMVLLLAAFQEFFAEGSESWLGRFDYQEAGPHLLLMAFLQRTINGGGRITREFAVGSGRADLVVEFKGRRAVIELKLYRGPDTLQRGITQLSAYLDRLGESEGYLVIFDRRKGVPWEDKLHLAEVAGPAGQRIYHFGM